VGVKKGRKGAGPAVVCCLGLRVIGVIISNIPWKPQTKKRKKVEEERRREEIGFFLFIRLILFLVMGSSWPKYPVPFAFWICLFFLRALAFRFRVKL
jgi:hypothetical protein